MCRTPCLLRVYGYERKIMVLIITVVRSVAPETAVLFNLSLSVSKDRYILNTPLYTCSY
jgi:hypothetical protein